MTRIVIDDVLKEKLRGLNEPLELCDDNGHVLARLNPVVDPAIWDAMDTEPTTEELKELMEYSGPTTSTEDLRTLLRKD